MIVIVLNPCDTQVPYQNWLPVTAVCLVLRLQMEDTTSRYEGVAMNIFNKQ